MLKNIKLFLIVLILAISNLYIFTTIAFNIKYELLIAQYNKLESDYKDLEIDYNELSEKYLEQEELYKEAMNNNIKKEFSLKEKFKDFVNIDNFTKPIEKEILKDVIGNIYRYMFSN